MPRTLTVQAAKVWTSCKGAGFRRGVLLRGFMYDFLQMFARHLDQRRVQDAEQTASQDAIEQQFAGVKIPFLR